MRQAKRQGYKNNSQRGFCRELFALIHIIGAAEWSPDTEKLAALSAEIVNQILVDILWGLSEPIGLWWLNSFVKRMAAGDYYFHYLRMCYFGASSIKRYNCEKKKSPFPELKVKLKCLLSINEKSKTQRRSVYHDAKQVQFSYRRSWNDFCHFFLRQWCK